jgi:uncharacterized delta-60 repeat protein
VTSFGFTAPGHGTDQASAVVLQKDGKIVVAGTATGEHGVPQASQFALARYNRNGTLDHAFGSNGLVLTSVGKASQNELAGLALASNGKIIVAGTAGGQFALARYTSTGNLDPTFGAGGTVTTALAGTQSSSASGLVLAAQGRIVVAGSAQLPDNREDFALARYDAAGKFDPGFGTGGVALTAIGTSATAYAVALASGSKVVVAGAAWVPNGGLEIAVARYDDGPSVKTDSGIEGLALVGPTSPVQQIGQPNSRPLAGAILLIEDADGDTEVARVATGSQGQFSLHLPPGRYRIVPRPPHPGAVYPRGTPQTIVVRVGEYTSVTVNYDSGIR